MTNETDQIDLADFEKPQMSKGFSVLTILSIIGCVLQVGGALYQFITANANYENRDATIAKMTSPDVPASARKFIGDPEVFLQTIIKNYENKIPILLLSLVAAGLCLYGVIQMRQLKKQGYLFYVIGEILPFVTMVLFLGTFALHGVGFMIAVAITVLFLLLYTVNRNQLKY